MKKPGLIAGFAALILTAPCQAVPITYNIDLTIGAGTATGFVQTDGNIGTLSTGDIASYDLVLTDGASVFEFQTSAGLQITGSALTATVTGLFFDFGGSNGAHFVFGSYLGFEDAIGSLSAHPSTISLNIFFDPNSPIWDSRSGIVQIAAVPEPSTWVMVILGFGGIGFMASRRKQCGSTHRLA